MPEIAPGTFGSPIVPIGRQGVDLNQPLTELDPLEASRLINWVHQGGELVLRPGQTFFLSGTGSGAIHSMRRGYSPDTQVASLFWGAGTDLVRSVNNGAPAILEGGFSGNPLTFVPIRKPQAAGSWMLIADSGKMRKSGLAAIGSLPIGLPAPGTAALSSASNAGKTDIAQFDATDGSQAASWSRFAGLDDTGAASGGTPTAADVPGVAGSAVAFTTVAATATTAYKSMAALPKTLNLAQFTTLGGAASSDDDLIHLYLRYSDPMLVKEVRVYFVCSPFAATASIPGTSPTENVAAYMHAFQPSDYAAFVAGLEPVSDAINRATAGSILDDVPTAPGRWKPGDPDNETIPQPTQPTTTPATQVSPGSNVWQEFSRVGLPVRRGDFQPIGTAGNPGTDWSTITGIYLVIWTTTNQVVTVSVDDCYLSGGSGPDTSEPGSQKYDYRYVHRDTRTGAIGNGSPTQAETAWLDALRQPIRVVPLAAYGSVFVRQDFYRRGGSLTDNWYYAGTNASDGGAFSDTLSDADLAAADTLPTDNFQPVATVDDNGNTVLAQPVPVVFGPIEDGVYCALGDPYRPGHLYSCIPGSFDAWPSTSGYVIELCSPSEELMNGCVWGGGGFVLSRRRGYMVHANPSEPGIVFEPTEVTPGLAARWGFCSGPGGIYYVATDGVRVTSGSGSTLLGANQLWPLFNGETVYGRLPINFAAPTKIRLALFDLDLWFLYQDTGGTLRCAIFSLLYQYWRFYDFGFPPQVVYADEQPNLAGFQGPNRLLMGGASGLVYDHSGTNDGATAPITGLIRTGSWTFGDLRAQKVLGDVAIDWDQANNLGSLIPYYDAETSNGGATLISATLGRRLVVLQPFLPAPKQVTSVGIELSISAATGTRPRLYGLGIAQTPFPEIATNRILAWGTWSTLSDKYLKGLLIDADTFAAPVTLSIEADGVVVQALTIVHAGRQVKHYSFPQVLGRLYRVTPTSSLPSQVLAIQPIFDEEPYTLARWETQLLDFAMPDAGWGSVLSADVCYRAGVACTLTITCYNAAGALTATLTAALPSTGGAKRKPFVAFTANKGVLYKIVVSTADGSQALTLYQEESRLTLQQWGGRLVKERPFGNSDVDPTRSMTNAILAAAKSGGSAP